MGLKTRANRYASGKYVEVDVVPVLDIDYQDLMGNKVGQQTKPAQQKVNDTRTKKWLRMAMQSNFKKDDYFLTLTFDKGEMPPPKKLARAKKLLGNFFDKLRRRYSKLDEELKYIWVMEYEADDDDEVYTTNVHFHLVLNAVLSRDEIEDCWSVGTGKKKKSLGYVTSKRIIVSPDYSLEDLAEYFTKGSRQKKQKKIWNSSRNLIRPYRTKNDSMFSQRMLAKMATSNDLGKPIIEKKYPKYHITYIKYKYTDYRGWHLYLRMWRKEADG